MLGVTSDEGPTFISRVRWGIIDNGPDELPWVLAVMKRTDARANEPAVVKVRHAVVAQMSGRSTIHSAVARVGIGEGLEVSFVKLHCAVASVRDRCQTPPTKWTLANIASPGETSYF
jgi:hypothetical protein